MFFSRSKSKLGIDIGTTTIKVVQLKKGADGFVFETYGVVNVDFQTSVRIELDVIAETAEILKRLLKESRVTTRKVVASLPNSIVFVSVITLPSLSEKELKDAVQWEARRYVPLPLEEVTISWSLLEEENTQNQVRVLLTAVPTVVIDNYLKMFRLAGLEPLALEIEALALIRSLVGERKESFIIIDLGAWNTSINLVDKGYLRVSRNLSVGGETITSAIAQSLHVSANRAEQFKKDLGLTSKLQQIPQTIKSTVETIKDETIQLMKFYETSGQAIQEIIFSGGGAHLPGLVNYFSDLGPKVIIGDPLQFVKYNSRLKTNLSQLSLSLAIALGLAMRS